MYKEIINFLTWPVLIAISYFIIAWVIRRYEKKTEVKE